jgi:hypothetical protein
MIAQLVYAGGTCSGEVSKWGFVQLYLHGRQASFFFEAWVFLVLVSLLLYAIEPDLESLRDRY